MVQDRFPIRIDEELSIRRLVPSDLESHYALLDRNREHIGVWEPWIHGVDMAGQAQYLQTMDRLYHEAGTWVGLILLNAAGQQVPVGSITYRIARDNLSVELGYWVDAGYAGRGIVTRAMRAVLRYAFEVDQLNKITLIIVSENKRSIAVAERLGFRFDGVFRDDVLIHGIFYDNVIYSLLRDEWLASQSTGADS